METTTPHYECTRCGNCCRWRGWVHITNQECEAISAFLGLRIREFTTKYTRLAPDRQQLCLTEKPDYSCVFLTEQNACQIQSVKPRQCQEFPNGWNFPDFQRSCRARIRH